MIYFDTKLEIDDGNRQKLQKHGVSLAQIEAFFATEPIYFKDKNHSVFEDRRFSFGIVDKRFIFVAFTLREKDGVIYIRPISARYARSKEVRKFYEKIDEEN